MRQKLSNQKQIEKMFVYYGFKTTGIHEAVKIQCNLSGLVDK